eukprot:scaffold92999_cov45-Prasinocladus_malaysianus.AAC.1
MQQSQAGLAGVTRDKWEDKDMKLGKMSDSMWLEICCIDCQHDVYEHQHQDGDGEDELGWRVELLPVQGDSERAVRGDVELEDAEDGEAGQQEEAGEGEHRAGPLVLPAGLPQRLAVRHGGQHGLERPGRVRSLGRDPRACTRRKVNVSQVTRYQGDESAPPHILRMRYSYTYSYGCASIVTLRSGSHHCTHYNGKQ